MTSKPLSEKAIFIDGEYMQFDRDVKEAVEKLKKELRRPLYQLPVCICSPYHNKIDPECVHCNIMKGIDKIFGSFE